MGHVLAGASPCVGVAVLCLAVRWAVVDFGFDLVVGAVARLGAGGGVVVVGLGIEMLVVVGGAVVVGAVAVAVVGGAVVAAGTVTVVSPVFVVGGGSASAAATPPAKSSATALPAMTPRSGIA
jgi:hypothetical protein